LFPISCVAQYYSLQEKQDALCVAILNIENVKFANKMIIASKQLLLVMELNSFPSIMIDSFLYSSLLPTATILGCDKFEIISFASSDTYKNTIRIHTIIYNYRGL
jgi:hypothetical protein